MITNEQFKNEVQLIIANAVREDVGEGDYTSLACIPSDAVGKAKLLIKDNGVIAGVNFAKQVFHYVDPNLSVETLIRDGKEVKFGDIAFYVEGSKQSILSIRHSCQPSFQESYWLRRSGTTFQLFS